MALLLFSVILILLPAVISTMSVTVQDICDVTRYLLIFPAFDLSVLYRLIYRMLDQTCPASGMIALC
jgi:hypothetical protein